LEGKQEDRSSKLNERTGNVYENKGMLPIARLRRGRYAQNGRLPPDGLAAPWTRSLSLEREQEESSSKLNERTGNVYENKGALWRSLERSGNVYENKGT
jgi:hypothetical protein